MERGSRSMIRPRRSLWRNAVAGIGALALVLTPGVGTAAEDGGDTAPGNNLSMPVIWAEPDATLRPVLRGTELASVLEGASVPSNDGTKTLFLQKDAKNTWQAQNDELAESLLADTAGKLPVSFVDWGDNLEVRDPGDGQQMIRVETRLMQTVAGMTGYSMQKVGEASGTDEMWGVVATKPADAWIGTQEQRVEAFAYTAHACLTLERIDVADDVVWDPQSGTWTGAGTRKCIGEGADGPGAYGAEVTISGGMTYGYVWSKPTPGLYRLTFSLEPESGIDFTDATKPYVTATTTLLPAAELEVAAEPAGNSPVILPELNISYLDVGVGYTSGVPTRPVNLTATPAVEAMALAWDEPVDPGTSPVSKYVVSAKRLDTNTTVGPVDVVGTSYTMTGLAGGRAYDFSVVAVNATGASAPTTVMAIPIEPKAPSAPVNLTAAPAINSMTLTWGKPDDPGTYPITAYQVRAKRQDTGEHVGPIDIPATSTSHTLSTLAGGVMYDFSVVAVSAAGTSAPATVKAMPLAATPAAVPAPVAAPVQVGKAVTVKARAVSGKSKIKVDVNPNLGKGYWKFQFEKQVGPNSWKLLSKVYKTQGSAEKLTVNLKKGTYRAVVLPKPGYAVATSAPVTLKR